MPSLSYHIINQQTKIHALYCMHAIPRYSLVFSGSANTPREARPIRGLQDSCTVTSLGNAVIPNAAATLIFSSEPETAPLYFPVNIGQQSSSLQLRGYPQNSPSHPVGPSLGLQRKKFHLLPFSLCQGLTQSIKLSQQSSSQILSPPHNLTFFFF